MSSGAGATKSIIFCTKSVIFSTKPIIFNTDFIVFNTEFIIFSGLAPGYRVLSDLIVNGAAKMLPLAEILASVKVAVEDGGENVNQRDIDDVTPLSRAVEAGCLQVVIYLLSKGADVAAKDAYLLRPVHYAAALGHQMILRVLGSRLPQAAPRQRPEWDPFFNKNKKTTPGLEVQDARGNTPLHMAARNGHLDCVKLLLEAGVECVSHVHLRNDAPEGRTGATPLMLACAPPFGRWETEVNKPAIVQMLLEHGCYRWRPDASTQPDQTARERMQVWHFMATPAVAEVVFKESQAQAWENGKRAYGGENSAVFQSKMRQWRDDSATAFDSLGRAPLHVAAQNGRTEIARFLLAKMGANVHAVTKQPFAQHAKGENALVCASHHGYIDVAGLLLDHGAGDEPVQGLIGSSFSKVSSQKDDDFLLKHDDYRLKHDDFRLRNDDFRLLKNDDFQRMRTRRSSGCTRNPEEKVSKNEEMCIKNEEFCIKNEELCINNDVFCSAREEWRGKRRGRVAGR